MAIMLQHVAIMLQVIYHSLGFPKNPEIHRLGLVAINFVDKCFTQNTGGHRFVVITWIGRSIMKQINDQRIIIRCHRHISSYKYAYKLAYLY